jgi:hypothetical protein
MVAKAGADELAKVAGIKLTLGQTTSVQNDAR